MIWDGLRNNRPKRPKAQGTYQKSFFNWRKGMNEKDLNKWFDKILSAREDIQELIKGFDEGSLEKVRGRFLYLAFQLQKKKGDIEQDKKPFVKLIQESIEMVQRHKDYIETNVDYLDTDKKFETKELWKELENKKIKLREKVEQDAWPELNKILNYIKANRYNLIWGFMLSHPESDLWQLVGDIGIETFERIFMLKVREGGQEFIFPNEKDLRNEGRQNIAKYLKEKFPSMPTKTIAEVINSQYPGDFVDERKIKYWLYEKETGNKIEKPLSPEKDSKHVIKIPFEDDPKISEKIFNAIQRRLFDKRFQDYLKERTKEDRRFARDRGKRKTVGKG